jgi:hypothetical protein
LLGVVAGITPIPGILLGQISCDCSESVALPARLSQPVRGLGLDLQATALLTRRISCVSATALCGLALELSDSCGMVLLQLPASAVVVEEDT